MQFLDEGYVNRTLRQMNRSKVFGADAHGGKLNPPVSEAAVRQFEINHNITLPAEYRHFVTHVGNGGAGPYYGIFPLGTMDGNLGGLHQWRENDGFIGILSEPFPLTEPWNLLIGRPDPQSSEIDPKEYERQLAAFEKVYFNSSLMNGALPICHMGCALRIWLIITGSQAGFLWYDRRADDHGLSPVTLLNGSSATFTAWYVEWLDNPLTIRNR